MRDVLASGKESFKIEVPYRLIETGVNGQSKPLLIYLHGFNQNIARFEKQVDLLLDLEAYHLFIQGPYPVYDRKHEKNVSEWGRAWYLYDGNQGQFIKSLEISAEFLQNIIDRHLNLIKVNRIGVFGYSMGGYLAGYFAMTRWKHVNELIVIGGRIKTELLQGNWEKVKHINILALHGKNDERVSADKQKKMVDELKMHGVSATFNTVDAKHRLNNQFITKAKYWLNAHGYLNESSP